MRQNLKNIDEIKYLFEKTTPNSLTNVKLIKMKIH